MPDMTDRGSVDNSDVVANATAGFTGIHDPQAMKNQKSVDAASQLHVAKGGRSRCRHLQTRGLTLGTEQSTSLIIDPKSGVFTNLHFLKIEHNVVGFVFSILNRTHQHLSSRYERRIEGFQLHMTFVEGDNNNQRDGR
jgi:hypothetical protein